MMPRNQNIVITQLFLFHNTASPASYITLLQTRCERDGVLISLMRRMALQVSELGCIIAESGRTCNGRDYFSPPFQKIDTCGLFLPRNVFSATDLCGMLGVSNPLSDYSIMCVSGSKRSEDMIDRKSTSPCRDHNAGWDDDQLAACNREMGALS